MYPPDVNTPESRQHPLLHGNLKFYTYRPYEEGRTRYYVVPEALADSVVKDDHLAKSKRFFRRTDSILSL